MLEATGEAAVVYDGAFRFLYVNAAAEQLMGLPRDAVVGSILWELFPDRAVPFREPLRQAMEQRIALTFEAENVVTRTWTEGRCIPLERTVASGPEAEEIEGAALAVFFRDVTDRHEALRARTQAELSHRRMEFLAEASAILSSSLDYQTTLEAMARIAVPDWCDWCGVRMPAADGIYLEQVAVAHVDPAKIALAQELARCYPVRLDEPGGVARVLRTGEPILMTEISDEALVAAARDAEHLRLLRELGIRSAIAVPLIARETVLGALMMITADQSGRRLDAGDLAFAQELARRAAVAIDNARLFLKVRRDEQEREALLQETRRRAEREALLNRIGEILRTLAEPDDILRAAVHELGLILNTDRCYFAEYDVPRDWARVGADWHRPDLPSLSGAYRLSALGVDAREMFRGPGGLLLANDLTDADPVFSPRAAATLTALGLRSIMGVALFTGGLPVAALVAAMADAPRAWTPDEIGHVRAVARLIHSAMEDARVRKREHDIAERLQEALQPALPGRVPGLELDAYYRPALAEANIGGDFFDVFEIEKGCFVLVMADLSGKGLAAAAQIATVRHMLRTLMYQRGTTVATAVGSLNDMLAEHNLVQGFATLFVGAYDVNLRTITYVNAGQEPGLILRKATGRVEELGPTGPVLGGFEGAVFTENVVQVGSGDVLALFTDGLTEAGPSRKDLLGVPGVTSVFVDSAAASEMPDEIVARIVSGIETLATPDGIRDDVCLLVASVV